MSIASTLIGLVTGNAGGVMDFFAKRAQLKNDLELAKIQTDVDKEKAWKDWATTNITSDEAWEEAQIRNSGWKDEWILILLSIPLIMVFIPPLAPYVLTGFGVLAQTPGWYQGLIVMIFAAVYGIRVWRRPTEAPPSK